jgi:hypothetical protein
MVDAPDATPSTSPRASAQCRIPASVAGHESIEGLLARLRERHGMTVPVVSHDAAVAERADRVVHLVDGQVG